MKGLALFTTLVIFLGKICFAQADSATVYFDRGKKETYKDSAYSYVRFLKQENLWYGKAYVAKTNALQSEGTYADKSLSTPVGVFKNYLDNGVLDNVAQYADGKVVEQTWYYKNGQKRSWISYDGKGESRQEGWDQEGKKIKDYVVEREARFKGGFEGWKRFLEKTLNANVAAEAGAPEGMHTVKVQFVVSKEGYVSNVRATEIPAACKPCAREAVAVLTGSPAWEPAVQNNVPVIYQAIQHISFQVEVEKKRGRRRS